MSFEISTLENGVRVVTQRLAHLETVAVGIWVGAGSRFESDSEHGIAHFLEHMAFKGTKRRSAKDIAEEIESVGGDINAATSLESTAYFSRLLMQELPLGLELLSDILINPTFESLELEREKNVIIQEIAASKDNPDDVIYDLVQEHAFPGQALGRPILGTVESIKALGAEDLRTFRDRCYSADAMVLAAAGGLEHANVVSMAEEHLGAVRRADKTPPHEARFASGFKQSPLRFEQGHLLVAYEGPAYGAEDYFSTQVLVMILGGGMSSRLFQEARERRGLCYSIYAFCWGVSDTGLFGVHAASTPDQIDELLQVVSGELEQMVEKAPSQSEVDRAKAQFKAGLVMSLESSSARVDQLARQTLAFGAPLAMTEIIGMIDAVTPETVQSAAKKVFDGQVPVLASLGPRDLSIDGKVWARSLGLAPDLAAE